MKKRVLVLNCGSLAGTDINTALKDNDEFELWGASTYKNHGIYTYKNYIEDIPNMNNPNFVKILKQILSKFPYPPK